MIETFDSIEQNVKDYETAKRISDTLFKFYPEHLWGVNVQAGVASVYNMRLSGRWGFQLLLSRMSSDAKVFEKQIREAGGEILERYYQPRGAFDLKYMDRDLVPDHG